MKIKTTVSEKTLSEYDRIMGEHSISEPYTTDGDCFIDLMESEIETDPDFVLDVDWLENEMNYHVGRDKEMIADAAIYGEPGLPEWKKDHSRFVRQAKVFSEKLESCPIRGIEI